MLSITVFLLCIWIIGKNNTTFSNPIRFVFFLSLGALILFSYINSTSLTNTILFFSISSLTIAATGFIVDLVSNNRISQLMMSVLAIVCSFYIEKGFNAPDHSIKNNNDYDPSAEIFLQIDAKSYPEVALALKKININLVKAFSPVSVDITELDDYFVIDLAPTNNAKEFIAEISSMNGIKWIEPNENIPFESPVKINSDELSRINSLSNDPSSVMQWHLTFLEMEKYYQYFKDANLKPKKSAKLFILDTGIDGRHEDLPNITKLNTDKQGHGTHCAGVAAAITNNGIGVASMAPDRGWIEIHGIQVIGDIGFGTQKSIIEGIIKAADSGADVISMSLGGITNQEREKAYNDAVKYANNKGAIVVVAAGNANLDEFSRGLAHRVHSKPQQGESR